MKSIRFRPKLDALGAGFLSREGIVSSMFNEQVIEQGVFCKLIPRGAGSLNSEGIVRLMLSEHAC